MKYFFFFFLLSCTACIDPTAQIKPFIKTLETHHQKDFKNFQSKYRSIRYIALGDSEKRPVLFIHGSPGNLKQWAEFLLDPELQKEFHLIAVDRPGYGGSGVGKAELSLQKQSDDIFNVLGINQSGKSPIVVGYSYAGAVSAKMAQDHKIGGLLFLAPAVDPSFNYIESIQYIGNLWGIKDIIPREFRAADDEAFALQKELRKLLPDWKRITSQVVVIHGDSDPIVSVKNVDFIQRMVSGGEILEISILPGVDHYLPWNEQQAITDAIRVLDKNLDQ